MDIMFNRAIGMYSLFILSTWIIIVICLGLVEAETDIFRTKRSEPGPQFLNPDKKTVSVIEGRGIALDCIVHNLDNKSPIVKWLRLRDSRVVAIGANLHIRNQRFRAYHNKDSLNVWTLEIFRVSAEDEGEYQCQVTTDRPLATITKKFNVVVEKLPMLILGGKQQVFEEGSSIELTCVFKSMPTKSKDFWYHPVDRRAKKISEIKGLHAVEVIQTKPIMKSTLVIPNASSKHEGEYLCKPDKRWVTWVGVRVVPAGILRSGALHKSSARTTRSELWFVEMIAIFVFCYSRI